MIDRNSVEDRVVADARPVRTAKPETTLRDAADLMSLYDLGFLPVVEDERIVGVLTDRDLALRTWHVRSIEKATVADIMTKDVKAISVTATLEETALAMGSNGVRRLPVTDEDDLLVGVISLDDIVLYTQGDETVGQILQNIAKPHRPIRIRPELGSMPVGTLCQKIRV